MVITQSPTQPEGLSGIKARQQATWAHGDYARIGTSIQITGESLCESMDIRAGTSVLDVAAGNGNASLAAARRHCEVVCTDYVPSLLDGAAARAKAEGLDMNFQVADAENLPFADHSFDNVISTFGAMFTPNQQQTAAELVRVCKPGGKIGMTNWSADGFIGQLFKTIGRYISAPSELSPPTNWASDEFINDNLATFAEDVSIEPRWFVFRYESPQHWLETFRNYYGPVARAFEALHPSKQLELEGDILALIRAFNRVEDGAMVVPSSYVEVIIKQKDAVENGDCHA